MQKDHLYCALMATTENIPLGANKIAEASGYIWFSGRHWHDNNQYELLGYNEMIKIAHRIEFSSWM